MSNQRGLAALELLDALDHYLATGPSWSARQMAKAVQNEHDIQDLAAWPYVERELAHPVVTVADLAARGIGFARTPAGEEGYPIDDYKHSQHVDLMAAGADLRRKAERENRA